MNKLKVLLAVTVLMATPVMADVLENAVADVAKDVAKQEAKNQAASALQGTGADKIIRGIDQVDSGMNQLKNVSSSSQVSGKSLADTAADKTADYARNKATEYVKGKAANATGTPDSVKNALEAKNKYDKAKSSVGTLKNNTEQTIKAADDLRNAFK
ncbi:hypothetical protein [Succinimonas amylolytica]|uniref:hypothetical protein n=2 Tax=Succinimonas amylolytica TaxID=83769 RepID=UPI0023A82EA7